MSFRLRVRLAVPAALAAGALAAVVPAVPALAAASPAWRISKVLGAPGYPDLQAIAASGRGNVWVSGTTTSSLVARWWNGSKWLRITPPAGFARTGSSVNDPVIGTSGPGNTWFFPQLSKSNGTVQYALRWDGKAWHKSWTTRNQVLAAAVTSPQNVWVFGAKPGAPGTLGWGPPWAIRYSGRGWHQVRMPGVVTHASTVTASDIWALGPTAGTASNQGSKQVFIAMHWNGRNWRSVKVPALPAVHGFAMIPVDVVALGPANVWVEDIVSSGLGGNPGPPGVALQHWNGHRWTTAGRDMADYFTSGMAADGHGGFWLPASNPSTSAGVIAHFHAGKWAVQPAPSVKGYAGQAGEFAEVPHTALVWGTGSLNPSPSSSNVTEGDIIRYP